MSDPCASRHHLVYVRAPYGLAEPKLDPAHASPGAARFQQMNQCLNLLCMAGVWASWALASFLAVGMQSVNAVEPWRVIPPTPALPPGTTDRYATVNGARIWYAEWGERAESEPVLLLHGGRFNTNYYGYLIPVLIAHRYRVIAMDSRGQGRSTRPPGPISYDLMASDVLGLLDNLQVPKVSLVGWSDGGIIAIDLAIRHPDRLRRLFAFGANADPAGQIAGADDLPSVVAHTAIEQNEYRALSPTPEGWNSLSAAINTMWSTLPQFTARQLHSIRVPTTIADGQYDEFIKPEHTRYMAAQIPGARLVILPRTSHFAMLQDPANFNDAVLRFLAN